MKRQHLILSFLLLMTVSSIGGAVGSGLTLYLTSVYNVTDSVKEVSYEAFDFTSSWAEAAPAVVSVVALKELTERYQQVGPRGASAVTTLTEVSSGTAFIISPDGLALTNKHVVADTEAEYILILEDGTELTAQVLDRDSLNDIAILLITGEDPRIGDLPYLDLADSDVVQVGEPVLAIGNALGEYANTTTAGIVSATGRDILAAGGLSGIESLVGLFQTDAAINPGNSGGPLVNLEGEVIGMNTAVDSTAAGIGFAIPSNDLQLVLDSYYEYGEIVRPYLGVRYTIVNPSIVVKRALKYTYGALITGGSNTGLAGVVEGGPAELAGLQENDVILTIDGEQISSSYTIANALSGHAVGDQIVLEVWRNEDTFKVSVELAEQ
jgi:serine protease Do